MGKWVDARLTLETLYDVSSTPSVPQREDYLRAEQAVQSSTDPWPISLWGGGVQGFDALRVLAEQYVLESCSAQATTNGVHVEITTACIGSKVPLDLIETPTARPVWTYRVRVENAGCETRF